MEQVREVKERRFFAYNPQDSFEDQIADESFNYNRDEETAVDKSTGVEYDVVFHGFENYSGIKFIELISYQ